MTNVSGGQAKAEIELSKKGDRQNAFRIRRFKNDHGLQVYSLENYAEGNRIFIPRLIFGRFRACVETIINHDLNGQKSEPFERTVSFLNQNYFYFKSSAADIENLIIQDIEEREGSSGYITVSRRCLRALEELLYSKKLQHPNDVLKEIISYHKLFQFSFVKGSKSITSALALRKDVLQHTERYNPRLAERVLPDEDAVDAAKNKRPQAARAKSIRAKTERSYMPKLGERFSEKDIRVDYDEIFGEQKVSLTPSAEASSNQESSSGKSKAVLSEFPVPLAATEIKAFATGGFYFELSPAESSEFRNRFISDRHSDFYLGFEIVDTLFTFSRSVRTFRFPLYYTKVRIRESGRGVHLEAANEGLIFLNHLALAQLVDKFSDTVAGVDHVDHFFKTLLAQDVSVDRINDRIRLSRYLPIKESIFDRTREILFGYADENGKGGILGDLKFNGIECDLQSVYLYRAARSLSPIDQALDLDLDRIDAIAHASMPRFYGSLLGRFLTPELAAEDHYDNDQPTIWMPGAVPRSTRNLMQGLKNHDLVLLEGPPGTGKTHTIMNLLIHCVNSRKRVLIVSDQQAAIEALIEKLQEYLIGDDRGTAAERRWRELLFGAIKVIDEVETGEQTLPELVGELSQVFKTPELSSESVGSGAKLEKRIKSLSDGIDRLTDQISNKMTAYMGEAVAFDRRVQKKERTPIDIQSLLEFLGLLFGKKASDRKLVDAFVKNRFELIEDELEACYSFFKIPSKSFDNEIKALQDDARMISSILQQKPTTPEAFQALTNESPRHEIIRYLEEVIQQHAAAGGNFLVRLMRKLRAAFKSPLHADAQILLRMVQDQIALLKKSDSWSPGLWDLMRDMHEAIRIGDKPCRALSLYRSIDQASAIEVGVSQAASIQGELEQIDDLFRQRDDVVKERFVESLREIVNSATTAKKRSGTSNVTSILALVDSLKQFNSIGESGQVFDELSQKLFETFPLWIVRKQMVSFILPCVEQSIDLVIVDESTQCRVDDALSLMFRAKKMLVVGDDRQTVLQKNSVIDDYLFKDHELDEHLRSTQARGFKGGGSNIFALVKSIKQASVMLDEHYRCPADIIEFSNRYVYENGLNIMQWNLPEHPASVIVDYSEQIVESSKKATSGKFKGIETEMLERFFDYVVSALKKIERTTGKKINVETDVALCYFLLKNEPYVKFIKDRYLKKLNRGEDILDGAGAALQGKERDYIFYFWDITRHNLGAFKQGDSADKRKGELNVLMSRPRKKAFHYLHRNFDQLEHGRSDISRYLWRCYGRQEDGNGPRRLDDDNLRDSLLGSLLRFTLEVSGKRGNKALCQNVQQGHIDFRDNIVVGDARRHVDLIAFPADTTDSVIGLIDLSEFGCDSSVGRNIVDYFFQLKRAVPGIDPVFTFPHELIDENSQTFRSLTHKLEHLNLDTQKKKAKIS